MPSDNSLQDAHLMLNEWSFRMRAFRLFLCIEILFFGLFYLVLMSEVDRYIDTDTVPLIATAVVFILIPFCIFWKSKVLPRVTFLKKRVEIPRYFFWVRKIPIESILSIEEIKFNDRELGVFVGLRDGGIINYNESAFQDVQDYLKFKRSIRTIVDKNSKYLNLKVMRIESLSWAQNGLLFLFSGTLLLVFLLLTTESKLDFHASIEIGALNKNIFSGEQIYRVASSFFLHLNSFHLAMNIASLALFGQFLLRVVDLYRFLSILLLSALIASLVTVVLSPYDAVIGASGGIMGVFGAYCCLKLLRYLPGSISSSSNVWILFFIAVQVALEYFVEGIDSYTHAGGFITGFVYMALCIKNEKDHSVFQSATFEKLSACVLTVCYLSGLVLFFVRVYAGT